MRPILLWLNVLVGIAIIGYAARVLPQIWNTFDNADDLALLGAFAAVGVLAFFNAAYIGSTRAEPSDRWNRLKQAWKGTE